MYSFYSKFNSDFDFLVKILFFPIGLIDIRVFLNFVKNPKLFILIKSSRTKFLKISLH